ncbi:MAG TPA: aspartate aminotransferase family protein [Candidatus Binataceae bacterium]|nr:aspartate aminotransferase family protein [Candidatus Binataceae bacterium]HVC44495.1 aspartate aminotransferase family protein [Candidatus Binataceae bacterium]
MSGAREDFTRHLAQTSAAPIGLEIVRAEGAWLYAADGRRYLDFIAGIGVSALGHGHPAVLAAIAEQARRHLHVMVYGEYVIAAQARLAARIAELLPPALGRVYFTNSGAEAIEGALKTARKHTGRDGFVAFDGAYHGDTMGALALMGNAAFRAPFGALPGPVRHLPYGDAAALTAIDHSVAAVVVEPVQAEGGVRIPSREFMLALRERCDRTGAVLIFDEVLTGLGRTGRLFAMEHSGVVPDLVVMAKALGGGLPLGAFAGRDELMAKLAHDPPLGHITTFGGHPLSCAAGLAALEVIVAERLWERAERVGMALRARLAGLVGTEIVALRGIGLLAGLEFAQAGTAHRFVAATIARGVIINWTLNADRVVRMAPPLTIADTEVDFALGAMTDALEGLRGGA